MRTPLVLVIPVLLLVSLGAGCAPPTPESWTRHSMAGGAYSLALPSGVRCVPLQGIDSDVAQCEGDGLRLTFDWGTYGGVPTGDVETERVGGREVRFQREEDGFVAGFVVPPVDHGDGTVSPADALVVHAECRAEAACETARGIVRTARLRTTRARHEP